MKGMTYKYSGLLALTQDSTVFAARVPGENHEHAASHWQTLSHQVVWITSQQGRN
jgi:hypothetical protein